MNKLEIKNDLSNFGEQAKKIWNSGLGVNPQNQKFMLWREAPKKKKNLPPPSPPMKKIIPTPLKWFVAHKKLDSI